MKREKHTRYSVGRIIIGSLGVVDMRNMRRTSWPEILGFIKAHSRLLQDLARRQWDSQPVKGNDEKSSSPDGSPKNQERCPGTDDDVPRTSAIDVFGPWEPDSEDPSEWWVFECEWNMDDQSDNAIDW
jgi:hypothetical protein